MEQSVRDLAELAPRQLDLLVQRLRQRRGIAGEDRIPRQGRETGDFPLSFAQERLWFLDRLEPGSAAYNVAVAMTLEGGLDVSALTASLLDMTRRHEVLRTVFRDRDGLPVQVPLPETTVPVLVVDLQDLPQRRRWAESEKLAWAEARRPFDLTRGPLLRALLVRTGVAEHDLVLVLHHIVADGWSCGVLVDELGALYGARRAGAPAFLAEPPVQYLDFAVWQRGRMRGEVLEPHLAFWRSTLDGSNGGALDLPYDRPPSPDLGQHGRHHPLELPPGLADGVRSLAEQCGATPFIVLLAAFGAALGRWAGQEDLVIASPVANRSRSEIERLVGFFVNTLPLRLDLAGDPPFRELVSRARAVVAAATEHQELPFEKLVQELNPDRGPGRSPLARVMLSFQPAPPELELAGLRLRWRELDTGTAKFDLLVSLWQEPGGLSGWLEHSAELFEVPTAARLAVQLRRLLAGAVEAPQRRLSDLPLLSTAERHQSLVEWNDTATVYPRDEPLQRAFERQAALRPEGVALVAGDHCLTYGELHQRAERLARRLRRLGAGPEARIAVCLERTAELVTALLGVLAAGAAYVPLDPAYPWERTAWILADSGASLVLTRSGLAERFAGSSPAVLPLDGAGHVAERQDLERLHAEGPAWGLAYVIYTSGSTGRPKGVGIAHRSAVDLVAWAAAAYSAAELAGVLASTSVCFDLSVFELFVPLSLGGTVVLVDSILTLVERPPTGQMTLVNAVPSAMAELVRLGALPATVRTVNLAGEALRGELARRLHATGGVERVLNLYGPSEDTTYSTWSVCEEDDDREPAIGRPLWNTRALVIDRWGEPAGMGVTGELFLGGDKLALGYVGSPELTAERFVPDPYSARPGSRLYRTGDRARWRRDGELEFLGRLDHQVKVRGYRVEPGEIEAALARHPEVSEAVVVARQEGEEGRRLVAYVVTGGGAAPGEAGLRAFLARQLPEHMVPTSMVHLAALPRTPGGKVDRQALPAPEPAAGAPAAGAPRTPTEELLAGLWSEVLGTSAAGPGDDFFGLGGHSLLATRLVSRIGEMFGVELPLRRIFEAPTLGALAATLDRERWPRALPPIRPAAKSGPLPLAFAQERLWFLDRLEPGTPVYNMPAAVRLAGALDPTALARALAGVVARHEVLRTAIETANGRPVQRPLPALDLPLPLVDLSGLPPAQAEPERERLAAAEALAPFDLARPPLLRARLVRLGEREHLLLLTLHHIVADGWSVGVLVRDLAAFYAGSGGSLPPMTVQYADYAVWQREQTAEGALAVQLAFWRETLAGELPVLELPTDRPRRAVQTHRPGRRTLELPPELTERLGVLARTERATLFMVLLAVFEILVGRLSGQDDVIVGAPVAGRTRPEVEGLVGIFLNSLALRIDLSGGPGLTELVRRVKATALAAYAHQDLPFESLLAELQPERDLARAPIFQVFFNMLSFPGGRMDLPGLALEELAPGDVGAKFDLTVYIRPRGGGLELGWVYATDLFDGARIEEMQAQYYSLLEQAVEQPTAEIHRFSLLTQRARACLPDPSVPLDAAWAGAVHAVFAAEAERRPDAVGVFDVTGCWTYGELRLRAGALAARLLEGGVRTGDVVAVFGHRSAPLVWAVLGTLWAGAAFLVLDPASPSVRSGAMLRQARPRAWLRVDGAPPPEEIEAALEEAGCRIRLTVGPGALGREDGAPVAPVGPDDLACMVFTSGSTGVPKGVLGRHGPLSHFIPWQRRELGLRPDDRFSMLSALAHDPLQRDLFTPLQIGAAICIPDAEEMGRPGWLASWMEREGVTVAHLTPAMGRLITEGAVAAQVTSLRSAFLVGDVLTRADAARLRTVAPGLDCVNFYGSTETQRAVGHYPVPVSPGDDGSGRQVLPLGRGIEDVQLLVLTPTGERAGCGELGEIHVRSPHLARGYLDDPCLTAARFLANPFASGPTHDRLYRTGDLGRYRLDGDVEFAGRADVQLKIRGFRVEPGEIEAQLEAHQAVEDAVVVAREDGRGERFLVAYWVARPGGAATPAELRAFLGRSLPDSMVPAAFVRLPVIPLTPNRKVDRRALPAPGRGDLETEAAGDGAMTPSEELLAGLWSDLLGLEGIGRESRFFELGGHSLLLTRLASRVRETFGADLPLRRFFEHPTLAALAREIELARASRLPVRRLPVERRPPEPGDLPLSFAQERLWFLQRLAPESPVFVLPRVMRINGALSLSALSGALGEVVRRHEALRTAFPVQQTPIQSIAPAVSPAMPLVDLRALPPLAREVEGGRVLAAEAQRPFDLAAAPLVRALALRLGDDEHLLGLAVHHLVADGWSMRIVLHELAVLYAARGAASPLPEPLQYADFTLWQRGWMQGELLAAELAYWRERLEGVPAGLDLPADRPRPREVTYRGGRLPARLPAPLLADLDLLGRRDGATLFMVLLAGFAALLLRATGRNDVVVGSPVSNRSRAELEGVVGLLVNTLALRVRLNERWGFADLLRAVRESALGAYDHQDLPFEKLVEVLHPERDLSRPPLFQTLLVLLELPRPATDVAGLRFTEEAAGNGSAQLDLSLYLARSGGELLESWEYSADLFDATTVARMASHLHVLLAVAAAEPRLPIADLPLLSEAEAHQLLMEWNDTAADLPEVSGVHRWIERQASLAPDALAVGSGGCWLTYGELDRLSNRLARHLRSVGSAAGAPIAICLERSAETVVGLLAILKAGSSYLPLDPEYPRERLELMLADSGVRVLLTREPLLALLPPVPSPAVCLDRDADAIARHGDASLGAAQDAGDLAYLLYTSGSTGRPKGVEIPHRALVNFLAWSRDRLGFDPGDRMLAVTSLSFDIAGLELYLPLISGGSVELASRDVAADGAGLAELLDSSCASFLQGTPATWRLLLAAGWKGRPGLRAVCGGETMSASLATDLCRRADVVWNLYGPTETTIWSTAHRVVPGEGTAVPLGRPIANTHIVLLDRRATPVPAGVAAELAIGGGGLARGYHRRPDLTAERFVPDPLGEPGGRLYRTGDLARWRPGGELEILGRIDHQVKVRGYRIEPGEIEAVLERHPRVRQCVVTPRELGAGDPGLVAYVVAEQETVAELRALLRRHLPDFMLPAAFVVLASLPLTPNGKVDRRALPAPAGPEAAGYAEVAPRTPVEEVLAALWADVLGIATPGIHDDFFHLGGHSLMAAAMQARIRDLFGIELPLRALFERRTVAALAETVEEARRNGTAAQRSQPVPVPRDKDLVLSFAQERYWLLSQIEPTGAAYNVFAAVRLRGSLDRRALEGSLDEIVRRHEVLRTTYRGASGRPGQLTVLPGRCGLPVVDLGALADGAGQAALLATAEARRPIDLAAGPMLRALLVRLEDADHTLLLTTHHIAFDGSMEVFTRELVTLYNALASGSPSPLPDLPLQYADFASWQRQWLGEEALEPLLELWTRRLQGLAPLLLPTDRPRPAVRSSRGAHRRFVLAEPLHAALRDLGRPQGATLYMTLLAAFQVLLCRWSGQADLAVGSPVADRPEVWAEGLIGCFVNTLVLRVEVDDDVVFSALLARVRGVALDAYLHKELPFERLLDALHLERDLGRTPLVQVMLALQNTPVRALELRGLDACFVDAESGTARFDLLLALVAGEDGLGGVLEHSTDLFDGSTMTRLLGSFEILLQAAAADPQCPVADLPLLSAAQRHQLAAEWNDTDAEFEEGVPLHGLFERQAASRPDAVAVEWDGGAQTYGELSRQAGRLAARLAALGVGPGALVGVHLDRGPAVFPALLGILAAGGAYVPMDLGLPPARMRFILESLDIAHVVADGAGMERLRESAPEGLAHRIAVDGLPDSAEVAPPPARSGPGDPAYVIFTSGSTGTPKGVLVRHRAAVNLVQWVNRTFGVCPGDRLLFVTSLGFDLSIYDVFGILAAGGTVRVCPGATLRDPERIGGILTTEGITFWDSAPAMLQQVVPFLGAPAADRRSLRLVFLSGDWIPVALPDQVRRGFPRAEVVSLGGATEATIWSNVFRIGEVGLEWASIPYGRPIQNARYYALDAHFAPQPLGVPGDLFIGGECLAACYAGAPDLTAAKFLPDPFSSVPGARMYRTGDLVRVLADGNLEFLGRVDHQVKIRGFRIELGEVEAVLGRCPGVEEHAVLLRESASGDRSLVAYVVAGGEVTAADLRARLRLHLPDYMVPASFVFLDRMPLSPSGKVDRKALPVASEGRAEPEETFVPPRDPFEDLVAEAMRELLGVDRLSVYDSFFDLGGSSLQATQLVARLRNVFRVELRLLSIFEAPTPAGLAASLRRALQEGGEEPAPPLRPAPRDVSLPLSFAQQRLWFLEEWRRGSAVSILPVAVRIEGKLEPALLASSLGEIVRRHEVLRTAFPRIGPRPVQVIRDWEPWRLLPSVDLSALPAPSRQDEMARWARQEASRSFDLARDLMLRAVLLCCSEREHVLLLTLHHIAADGWSMGILVRELSVLYGAFSRGEPSPLPELPVQYADFAHWQRLWLVEERLERQLGYWRRRLGGKLPVQQIVPDRQRPEVARYAGASAVWSLGPEATSALLELARREGATLFMILLAGLAALLCRATGRDDVVVGTDIANRNRAETEGLIGFFVNQLVLRVDVSGDPDFLSLLGRVREVALGAYAHQDLPFERLVEALHAQPGQGPRSLFQVKLIHQNVPMASAPVQGLRLTPVNLAPPVARFEVALFTQLGEDGGVSGLWVFDQELFRGETVRRLSRQLRGLLEQVALHPERKLSRLEIHHQGGKEALSMPDVNRESQGPLRFKSIKPKPLDLSQTLHMVQTSFLESGAPLPLVVSPALEGVDLPSWARQNRGWIEERLARHGALLFRGFGLGSAEPFESFAQALCEELFNENGEHPRTSVSGKVYTPVFYPPEKQLLWHNENSFNHRWPLKIWFGCAQAPEKGGETPVVDSREVFRRLSPALRERFVEKGVMYVRNYGDGLGLDWRTVLQADGREEAERRCSEQRMQWQWRDGDRLRTRAVRPAVIPHPRTGELSWFNQAQHWHVSCLDPETRRSLESLFAEEDLPRNCYYGDGSRIEDSVMDEILGVYRELEASFRWQVGDVMLVDNVLAAHGRNPFEGKRQILVAMGEMTHFQEPL